MKRRITLTAIVTLCASTLMYAIIYGLLGEFNPKDWPMFFRASCAIYLGFIIICAYDAIKSLEQ